MGNFDHYVYGNFDHFAYGNKVHVLTPEPLTEGTVHVSPFLLQLDIFGKLLKCLTKVCYLKLKNSDIWTNSDNLSRLRPLVETCLRIKV